MSRYVLDSFAVLAEYWQEPGAPRVRQILNATDNQLWLSVVNLGEVYYRIAREEDTQVADEALKWLAWERIEYVEADLTLTLTAARIKAEFALSYADCFAAALAQRVDGAVITGDREFEKLELAGIVSVEWIAKPR